MRHRRFTRHRVNPYEGGFLFEPERFLHRQEEEGNAYSETSERERIWKEHMAGLKELRAGAFKHADAANKSLRQKPVTPVRREVKGGWGWGTTPARGPSPSYSVRSGAPTAAEVRKLEKMYPRGASGPSVTMAKAISSASKPRKRHKGTASAAPSGKGTWRPHSGPLRLTYKPLTRKERSRFHSQAWGARRSEMQRSGLTRKQKKALNRAEWRKLVRAR